MQVITGYGFFKDNDGNIIAKAELPFGEHPIKPGYIYVEVVDKAEMEKVEIYIKPLTDDEKKEILIREKIRNMAIIELQKEGKLAIS